MLLDAYRDRMPQGFHWSGSKPRRRALPQRHFFAPRRMWARSKVTVCRPAIAPCSAAYRRAAIAICVACSFRLPGYNARLMPAKYVRP